MRLSKGSTRLLLTVGIAALLLFLGRGMIAKAAVSAAVKAVTGLPLRIERLQVEVFRTAMGARGIQLLNPAGFSDLVMADLPELTVDYDLPAFFQGRIHLEELRVHLRELVVVRNEEGRLNLDALSSVQEAKARKDEKPVPPAAPKKKPLQIDRLHLKVGKVIYKDYSRGGSPFVQEFHVNLDEHYAKITDPTALGSLIVSRALFKTTVAQLAGFDLKILDQQVRGILQFSMDAAAGIVEDAAEAFRSLLPISKTQERDVVQTE